jgi:hypothetical protein
MPMMLVFGKEVYILYREMLFSVSVTHKYTVWQGCRILASYLALRIVTRGLESVDPDSCSI